jgi:serine/threonine protein kinase
MKLPQPNDRVSEYVLIERVGTGAFGQVFKARHHVWPDQIVAIKIPTDPDYVRMLRREGIGLHQVSHRNIVKPIGFDPFADPPYLVMEYIGGGDLRQLLWGPVGRAAPAADQAQTATVAIPAEPGATACQLPIPRVVELMTQILEGLAAAHAAKLLHLDLKPSNILLTEDGVVKLTDFGLGRALLRPGESVVQSLSMAAEAHSITGTLEYMSPEQRRGLPLDERADIYAAGVILFELITGERPAGGERPSELRAESPAWLDEIFTRSYARLEWRYPSAGAMLADLRELGRRAAFIQDAAPAAIPVPVAVPAGPPPLPGERLARADDGPARNDCGAPPAVCPACSRSTQPDDQFCIHCGQQLVSQIRRCPRCGSYPQRHDQYCVLCGTAL